MGRPVFIERLKVLRNVDDGRKRQRKCPLSRRAYTKTNIVNSNNFARQTIIKKKQPNTTVYKFFVYLLFVAMVLLGTVIFFF